MFGPFTFSIYRHSTLGDFKAVKEGNAAVGGFFFGWFWLMYRKLWLKGAVFLVVAIASIPIWHSVMGTFAGQYIPISIMVLITGFQGNKWYRQSLIEKGYEEVGEVEAKTEGDALEQYTRLPDGDRMIMKDKKAPHLKGQRISVKDEKDKLSTKTKSGWKKPVIITSLSLVFAFLALAMVVGMNEPVTPMVVHHTSEGITGKTEQFAITFKKKGISDGVKGMKEVYGNKLCHKPAPKHKNVLVRWQIKNISDADIPAWSYDVVGGIARGMEWELPQIELVSPDGNIIQRELDSTLCLRSYYEITNHSNLDKLSSGKSIGMATAFEVPSTSINSKGWKIRVNADKKWELDL